MKNWISGGELRPPEVPLIKVRLYLHSCKISVFLDVDQKLLYWFNNNVYFIWCKICSHGKIPVWRWIFAINFSDDFCIWKHRGRYRQVDQSLIIRTVFTIADYQEELCQYTFFLCLKICKSAHKVENVNELCTMTALDAWRLYLSKISSS